MKDRMMSLYDDAILETDVLKHTAEVQKRAIEAGFKWDTVAGVLAKIKEELAEVEEALKEGDAAHIREEMGDLLFSVAILGYYEDVCPSILLKEATEKYIRRYQAMEAIAEEDGSVMEALTLEGKMALWRKAKARTKTRASAA